MTLLDFALHVDLYLSQFIANYGDWVYLLLFVVIFVETGVVVMPLLPGDSLLFVVGALCGLGLLELPSTLGLLAAAAILGNQTNYALGRLFGERVFHWGQSRVFNRRAFDRTHEFYEKYGGFMLIAGRFMPFVRTFAPFVAGVARMTRTRFTLFDVSGALLWVGSITTAGYLFGNLAWVKANLSYIVWSMILVPGLLVVYGGWKSRRRAAIAS